MDCLRKARSVLSCFACIISNDHNKLFLLQGGGAPSSSRRFGDAHTSLVVAGGHLARLPTSLLADLPLGMLYTKRRMKDRKVS